MQHKLLIILCLLGSINLTSAQKKKKHQQAEYPVVTNLTIPGTAFLRSIPEDMEIKFDYKQMNAPIPRFNILNYQNKNTTDEVLNTGGNLILMMFNPTCDHCEEETRTFIQNIFLFKKSKILLVAAPVQTANLGYFESNVKFSQYPSTITVAIDSAKVIDKIFTYQTLPQINIYDGKSMRLLKTFEGFTPLDSLKKYIE